MGKPQETHTVIMQWTEKELKDRGMTIFMRKYWIGFLLSLGGIFVALYYCITIPNNTLINVITACIVLFSLSVYWLVQSYVGGKYWDKLKSMGQPIKLERLPSVWWLFKRK